MAFVDRQRKSRERNRPAVNFTQRDDVREFAGSGIGRNYNRMMDLQSQKDPNLQDLKQARRQWNRYDKYNAAEMLGRTPMGAQDTFMKDTETFRQLNPQAFGTMYPKTQGAMKAGESGGLLGLVIKGLKGDLGKLGKDIKDKIGITGMVDDTVDVQDKYVTDTFGPHLEDIEELDFTEEYAGPWPHEGMPPIGEIENPLEVNLSLPTQNIPRPHEGLPPIMGDAEAKWERYKKDVIEQKRKLDLGLDASMRGHPHKEYYQPTPSRLGEARPHLGEDIRVEPWLGDPAIPMPEELTEGEYLPGEYHDELIEEAPDASSALYELDEGAMQGSPPYQGREFGLGQFMDTMPKDWQDYLEDLERVGDMPGGHLTYEEWHDAMRRRR